MKKYLFSCFFAFLLFEPIHFSSIQSTIIHPDLSYSFACLFDSFYEINIRCTFFCVLFINYFFFFFFPIQYQSLFSIFSISQFRKAFEIFYICAINLNYPINSIILVWFLYKRKDNILFQHPRKKKLDIQTIIIINNELFYMFSPPFIRTTQWRENVSNQKNNQINSNQIKNDNSQ